MRTRTVTARGARGLAVALLLGAGLGMLPGCATTRLATEWTDTERAPQGYRTWFVLAAMPDPVKRRQWEDAFVRQLATRGVSATPSHRLFPESFPDTAEARTKLREGGFDGLLTVRKGAEDEVQRRSGGAGVGVGGTFMPFWGMYVSVFHQSRGRTTVEPERVVGYDVEVWEGASSGRMVWAGRTPLVQPAPIEQVSRDVASTVVPRLVSAKLLP